MYCKHCDQKMHRETAVRVLRVGAFGRTRAIVQPGWHCWTCKAAFDAPAEPPAARELPGPSRRRLFRLAMRHHLPDAAALRPCAAPSAAASAALRQ